MERVTVFLGTPMYANACLTDGWANSVFTATISGGPVNKLIVPEFAQSSLLPLSFNKLWMQAVIGKADIFAMLHADICAEPGWLDELVTTLGDHSADMVSAGVRIKDDDGDMSVALDLDPRAEHPFHLRRLSMQHLLEMPVVYSRHDAAKAIDVDQYGPLLLNTGCFAVDLRRPWVRCTPFQLNAYCDWENETVYCESEDWYFSRLLYRSPWDTKQFGRARIYGTKRIRTQHLGVKAYDSHYLELRESEKNQTAHRHPQSDGRPAVV